MTRHVPDRDALITQNAGMARRIANKIARRVPDWVDTDDLESAALLGLTEAAHRYDTSRGEPFQAFAIKRMRGAVLDELRRRDRIPRQARVLLKRVRAAEQRFETRCGRPANDEEIAASAGLERAQVAEARQNVVPQMTSFDDQRASSSFHIVPDVIEHIEHRQRLDAVATALARLQDRERSVVEMYYRQGVTLNDIGASLGVTESRACQLRSQAIRKLRKAILARRPCNNHTPPAGASARLRGAAAD